MTYTITSTGEEVTFPASGVRRSDMLLYAIGYDGYYWSSSVANATAAYNLGFNYKDVHSARPDPRAWERSVRCYVQN
jgi:hypothetical protein